MLYLDFNLPDGVLVDQPARALHAAVADSGGIWLQAVAEHVETDGERAMEWRARVGSARATPAARKAGNCRLGAGGVDLVAGRNCGFIVEKAVPEAMCTSVAVLYRTPGKDILTLVSIAPCDAKNHLFLFEEGGVLGLKDRDETAELTVACDTDPSGEGLRLAVAGLSQGRLYLRQGSGPVVSAPVQAMMLQGVADLFIGCRNHRESLVKTFGTGSIASVILWPGVNVLDPQTEAATQVRALDAYRFWEA